ncbi:MAG: MFS transporter [Anaerolineae bacterium]|nr:MFS transporter [Anaerolineae bacterium]
MRVQEDETVAAVGAEASTKRSFFGGIWHGAFLALGTALTQPTTVVAAFIVALTGSTVWVGGLSTVLSVATALPQLFFARWIQPRPRKKPFLLLAVYLRVLSWGLLAWMIVAIGSSRPQLLTWALVGLLAVFSIGGGIGGVPYTDIIGKVIPADRRGAFFGGRQLLSGPLAVGAAMLSRQVLREMAYPNAYALLFGLAAVALFIASFGVWMIREPAGDGKSAQILGWRDYAHRLWKAAGRMKLFIAVQMLTAFSLMAGPFYVVYASQKLDAPAEAVGLFTLFQVLGGAPANLLWAHLVDRYGSWRMLTVCATVSALTPLLAIGLGTMGWMGLLPVFLLFGATLNGRTVGFSSVLLEIAPPGERPTYSALSTWLMLPAAFLPMVAGTLLQVWSFATIFGLTAAFIGLGAVLAWRLNRCEARSLTWAECPASQRPMN